MCSCHQHMGNTGSSISWRAPNRPLTMRNSSASWMERKDETVSRIGVMFVLMVSAIALALFALYYAQNCASSETLGCAVTSVSVSVFFWFLAAGFLAFLTRRIRQHIRARMS